MNPQLRRHITKALYLADRAWEQLLGWRALGIRRSDRVLDVGSGGHPFIRADVLCDKFLFDNVERQRGESLVMDRPLVIADASRLPFRDHAFDFSRSSHLLEHLDDPEGHMRELERVSRRGVIITPSEAWERIYPIAAHRWMLRFEDGRLLLREKPSAVFDEYVASVFHGRLERYGFSYFWNYFRDVFEVRYRWEGKVEFDVERMPDGTAATRLSASTACDEPDGVDVAESHAKRRLKTLASRVVRRLGSAHYHTEVWTVLVCPACHGDLRRAPESASCAACGRTYPVHAGRVPVLLL